MIKDKRKLSRFSDRYRGDRTKMIEEVCLLGSIAAKLRDFTYREFADFHKKNVGGSCERTIRRYLADFEANGLVEKTREKRKTKQTGTNAGSVYVWQGWPDTQGKLVHFP